MEGCKGRGRCGVCKGLQGGRTPAAANLSGLLPAATYSEADSQEPAAPADAVTADVGLLKLCRGISLNCIALHCQQNIVRAVVGELLLSEKSRHLEGKMKVVSDLFVFICSRF